MIAFAEGAGCFNCIGAHQVQGIEAGMENSHRLPKFFKEQMEAQVIWEADTEELAKGFIYRFEEGPPKES